MEKSTVSKNFHELSPEGKRDFYIKRSIAAKEPETRIGYYLKYYAVPVYENQIKAMALWGKYFVALLFALSAFGEKIQLAEGQSFPGIPMYILFLAVTVEFFMSICHGWLLWFKDTDT